MTCQQHSRLSVHNRLMDSGKIKTGFIRRYDRRDRRWWTAFSSVYDLSPLLFVLMNFPSLFKATIEPYQAGWYLRLCWKLVPHGGRALATAVFLYEQTPGTLLLSRHNWCSLCNENYSCVRQNSDVCGVGVRRLGKLPAYAINVVLSALTLALLMFSRLGEDVQYWSYRDALTSIVIHIESSCSILLLMLQWKRWDWWFTIRRFYVFNGGIGGESPEATGLNVSTAECASTVT
jgi:hypothetical protein